MATVIPTLEGSLYLKDPLTIIAYTLRRYFRQPANTIPILSELIISLPARMAQFGREPDNLVRNIQADLQMVFDRIFAGDRKISVNTLYTKEPNGFYTVTISIGYSKSNGDIEQTGVNVYINDDGRLVIPEDTVSFLSSYLDT